MNDGHVWVDDEGNSGGACPCKYDILGNSESEHSASLS